MSMSAALETGLIFPIPTMYGMFAYIYHTNQPNVGEYTRALFLLGSCLLKICSAYMFWINPHPAPRMPGGTSKGLG